MSDILQTLTEYGTALASNTSRYGIPGFTPRTRGFRPWQTDSQQAMSDSPLSTGTTAIPLNNTILAAAQSR